MKQRLTLKRVSIAELLIMTAVLAVFIMISIATFFHYKTRFYYRQMVVNVAQRYQIMVNDCIKANRGQLNQCNLGINGIPVTIQHPMVNVTINNGKIVVTPLSTNGIQDQHSYILTPNYQGNRIKWTASGGGCKAGVAPGC